MGGQYGKRCSNWGVCTSREKQWGVNWLWLSTVSLWYCSVPLAIEFVACEHSYLTILCCRKLASVFDCLSWNFQSTMTLDVWSCSTCFLLCGESTTLSRCCCCVSVSTQVCSWLFVICWSVQFGCVWLVQHVCAELDGVPCSMSLCWILFLIFTSGWLSLEPQTSLGGLPSHGYAPLFKVLHAESGKVKWT